MRPTSTLVLRPLTFALLMLVGCAGKSAPTDAGSMDAALDAGSEDAAMHDAAMADTSPPMDAGDGTPGPVRITLAFGGALAVDVPVVFWNADDSLVEIVRTDATGSAVATMRPGGSVSALYTNPSGNQTSIYTMLGVKPGDELRVGHPDPVFSNIDVLLPPSSGASARYSVRSRCGGVLSTPASASMRVLTGCSHGDLFVSATQGTSPYGDYGAFLLPDVDFTGALDLTSHSYAPATPITEQLEHTPDTMIFANSTVYVTTPSAGIWMNSASGDSAVNYASPLTPTSVVSASVSSVSANANLVDTTLAHTGATGGTAVRHVQERLAFTTAYALDVSS